MSEIVGVCGITCNGCECYNATLHNSDEERKQVAEKWAKMHSPDIKPEDINCEGCMAGGKKFNWCDKCGIRLCGVEKGVATCAHCKDYPCDKLNEFLQYVPPAKAKLEEIRKGF